MEQLYLWNDNRPATQATLAESEIAQSEDATVVSDEVAALAAPRAIDREAAEPCGANPDPPIATPLSAAVEAGIFGVTSEGPIVPDEVQVVELTAEHANEMIIMLADSQVLEDALRLECDPATGRVPTTNEEKQVLLARLDKEWKRLLQAYADAVAAYADGFGEQAAEALDHWVRKSLADGDQKKEPYPPSHPWHYFHTGDNAMPISVDQIEAAPDAGRWIADRLPKNPAKRAQKLQEMLAHEQEVLATDRERYVDIVRRGAEALSRYDREIAHTSDAMAVATALALKYNHISLGLGRVTWISQELEKFGSRLFQPR